MAFRTYFLAFFAALSLIFCQADVQAAPAHKTRHAVQVKAGKAHAVAKKGSARAEKATAATSKQKKGSQHAAQAKAEKKGGKVLHAKKHGEKKLASGRHADKGKKVAAAGKEKKHAAKISGKRDKKSLAASRSRKHWHSHSYKYPRHTASRSRTVLRKDGKAYPSYTGLLPSVRRPDTRYRANLCPTVVSLGMNITDIASTQIGLPYRSGGTSPATGFDCSGFVQWVFAKQGVRVPRSTYELRSVGREVSKSSLLPGDILIFRSPRASSGLHTGIYVGNNKFIHSPHTGSRIHIEDLDNSFYRRNYLTARRILKAPPCDADGYSNLTFLDNPAF